MTLVKNRAKKLSVAHCRYFNVKGLSVATQRQCWTFVARIEGAMNDVGAMNDRRRGNEKTLFK